MAAEKHLISGATVADCNLDLLRSQHYVDMVFVVGSTQDRFPCHQLILMSRSAVFRSLFSNNWNYGSSGWKKSSVHEIHLPDVQPCVFRQFLEFIYGDCCELSLRESQRLLPIAHKYGVQSLIQKCEEIIIQKGIQMDGAICIYETAAKCNLASLKQAAGVLIAKGFSRLLTEPSFGFESMEQATMMEFLARDDLLVDEIQLFYGVIRWSDAQSKIVAMKTGICPEQKKSLILRSIIPLIRFPLMNAHFISSVVVPQNVLQTDETNALLKYFSSDATVRACISKNLRFSSKPRRLMATTTTDVDNSSCWMNPAAAVPVPEEYNCQPLPPLIGWNY